MWQLVENSRIKISSLVCMQLRGHTKSWNHLVHKDLCNDACPYIPYWKRFYPFIIVKQSHITNKNKYLFPAVDVGNGPRISNFLSIGFKHSFKWSSGIVNLQIRLSLIRRPLFSYTSIAYYIYLGSTRLTPILNVLFTKCPIKLFSNFFEGFTFQSALRKESREPPSRSVKLFSAGLLFEKSKSLNLEIPTFYEEHRS